MSTGLETWIRDLNELGPLYPFQGTEVYLVIAGVAVWLLWHRIQFKREEATLKEEKQRFSDKATLEKAMDISNAETLEGTIKGHASGYK